MIAGNFFEILQHTIGLADEAENHCNQYMAPYMLVDGVSVSTG
jgi:predicted Zn-dependent protease